jgi:hypothetical protein
MRKCSLMIYLGLSKKYINLICHDIEKVTYRGI